MNTEPESHHTDSAPPSPDSALALAVDPVAAQIKLLFECNADGIIVIDHEGKIVAANPMSGRLFEKSAQALLGEPFGRPIIAGETAELTIPLANGGVRYLEMLSSDVVWAGQPAHLTTLRDITSRKQVELELEQNRETLRQLSERDPLTGLSNRRGFKFFLDAAMARARRSNEPLAVLLLDLPP